MGLYVHYIWQKPKKKRKSKATQRREEEVLSSDKPYELEEKMDEAASTPIEGPQEEPSPAKEGMSLGTTADNVPMEQGWGRPHWKKKKLYTSQTLTINMLHRWIVRQLNCSGMVTQGRAGVVDTVPASSRSFHFKFYYSQIHLQAQNHANAKERKKRERKQVLYILLHIQLEWHTGDVPRRGECKEAHQGLLVCTYYIGGCQKYSQLAISRNPKSCIVTYCTREYYNIIFAHVRF